jgi:hypothetical protein
MIEEKKPPNVGGQAEQPKFERDIQQAKASQASPPPEPVQSPKPGRKPLFRH